MTNNLSSSEVMSRLPVISSSEVLTELNNERESSEAGDEDEVDADDGLEVEGLIPVMKKEKPQGSMVARWREPDF